METNDLQGSQNRILTHMVLDKAFYESLKGKTIVEMRNVVNDAQIDPNLQAAQLGDDFFTRLGTAVNDNGDLETKPIQDILILKTEVMGQPAPASW
ncbi:MAG: hypothetical protein ABUK01_03970 [Leptospirales bacterium]